MRPNISVCDGESGDEAWGIERRTGRLRLMRRLSSISLEAGRRLHDAERRLVWSCFRRPCVMARCGGPSKRDGIIELCSITEPASAATAAWARCADKDSWVSSTMTSAIVRGIELRINVGTRVENNHSQRARAFIAISQQLPRPFGPRH